MNLGEARIKKAKGENFHQKGQKVWIVGNKAVTVKRLKGRAFGVVVKDSIWPDMFVSIELWDKEKGMDYLNGKVRVKCPQRLR